MRWVTRCKITAHYSPLTCSMAGTAPHRNHTHTQPVFIFSFPSSFLSDSLLTYFLRDRCHRCYSREARYNHSRRRLLQWSQTGSPFAHCSQYNALPSMQWRTQKQPHAHTLNAPHPHTSCSLYSPSLAHCSRTTFASALYSLSFILYIALTHASHNDCIASTYTQQKDGCVLLPSLSLSLLTSSVAPKRLATADHWR